MTKFNKEKWSQFVTLGVWGFPNLKCWGTIKQCTTWQKDFYKSSKSKSNHPSKKSTVSTKLQKRSYSFQKDNKRNKEKHQGFPDNLTPPVLCSLQSTVQALHRELWVSCWAWSARRWRRKENIEFWNICTCKAVSESEVNVTALSLRAAKLQLQHQFWPWSHHWSAAPSLWDWQHSANRSQLQGRTLCWLSGTGMQTKLFRKCYYFYSASNCSESACINSVTQLLLTCPPCLILSVNFTPVQFNSISW